MNAWVPPLLDEHPLPIRAMLAVVAPALFGIALGYFLGVSAVTYLVLSALGMTGGVGAGFDHVGARAGTKRGISGGAISGAAILAAHSIQGSAATVALPEPRLLVPLAVVIGMAFGAVGGRMRQRRLAVRPRLRTSSLIS